MKAELEATLTGGKELRITYAENNTVYIQFTRSSDDRLMSVITEEALTDLVNLINKGQ